MACFWNSPDVVVVEARNVQRGFTAARDGIKELLDRNESPGVEISEIACSRSCDGIVGADTAIFNLKPVNGRPELMAERWSDLRT